MSGVGQFRSHWGASSVTLLGALTVSSWSAVGPQWNDSRGPTEASVCQPNPTLNAVALQGAWHSEFFIALEVVVVEAVSFDKINRAFGKKKKLEEVWVLFDNYACCFQVKIIKRITVNEWLTQFRVYLKFIAENLLMTPEERVLFPLLLCCSTAIYTWRRNSVLFALLTHFGFPSQPLRQETSLPNERCTAISC